MGLVSKVGRRTPRARLAMATLYLLMTLGAITTLYPFALMVTTGFKGATDQNDPRLIPAFWRDDAALLAKYRYDKNGSEIAPPEGEAVSAERLASYEAFLMELPLEYWHAGFRTGSTQVTSRLTRRYQRWLRERYRVIDALNAAYIEENAGFQTVAPPAEMLDRRNWTRPTDPKADRKYREWLEFKAALPAEYRMPIRAEGMYREWAREHYKRLDAVPAALRGDAADFATLAFPAEAYHQTAQASDASPDPVREAMAAFRGSLPTRNRGLTADDRWARHLGLPPGVAPPPMPADAFDVHQVETRGGALRREFSGRNYAYVLDYLLLNSRALGNTVLFCLLAVLTQLTVNPLAAYALSRYPIRASGKILLFLLATMAFPAEVAMIPSFLLLKDLGLLNTFAALVLPTVASGYMIFLLKGFFDSLPQELFEAGQLDGARETTLLTRIALPLSKPVLGYLGLLAFMGAYGAFLYAFLVAQDQKMWTLMVWIYQLQNIAPKAVMMAALTLAALPTLAVFLLAQRVIMRGIVLPGER